MIEIVWIDASTIESWYLFSVLILPAFCRFSIRNLRRSGQTLKPPRTIIIDITLATVFRTTAS